MKKLLSGIAMLLLAAISVPTAAYAYAYLYDISVSVTAGATKTASVMPRETVPYTVTVRNDTENGLKDHPSWVRLKFSYSDKGIDVHPDDSCLVLADGWVLRGGYVYCTKQFGPDMHESTAVTAFRAPDFSSTGDGAAVTVSVTAEGYAAGLVNPDFNSENPWGTPKTPPDNTGGGGGGGGGTGRGAYVFPTAPAAETVPETVPETTVAPTTAAPTTAAPTTVAPTRAARRSDDSSEREERTEAETTERPTIPETTREQKDEYYFLEGRYDLAAFNDASPISADGIRNLKSGTYTVYTVHKDNTVTYEIMEIGGEEETEKVAQPLELEEEEAPKKNIFLRFIDGLMEKFTELINWAVENPLKSIGSLTVLAGLGFLVFFLVTRRKKDDNDDQDENGAPRYNGRRYLNR